MKTQPMAWLLLLAMTGVAMAQERTDFARYSIAVPAGWTSKIEGAGWIIHPSAGANECGIAPMPPVSGVPRDEARRQMWETAVKGRRVLQVNPTESSRDPNGRTWTTDAAVIEEAGVVYVLALGVVELGSRVEGFLVVGTPQGIERHQKTIDAMFDSIRPLNATAASSPAPAGEKSPPSGRPSPVGTPGPNSLAGVFTATTHELRLGASGLANQAVVGELILFSDGAALWGMPPEGLLGFNRETHRKRFPERWGTYTLRDKRLSITRAGKEQQYAILPTGALENHYMEGGQERTGPRYLPRPSLDGVRLEGEVRRKDHWPAPGNTSGIGTLRGCTFASDGTFQDEKLMWIVLPEKDGTTKQAHDARVAPGRGRYRLEHYSLVLEYDDGRVNQVSFITTNREKPLRDAILNGYPVETRP